MHSVYISCNANATDGRERVTRISLREMVVDIEFGTRENGFMVMCTGFGTWLGVPKKLLEGVYIFLNS